jgi:hypothetical protein
VEESVSNVRQKRLPGVPRTHLASLSFRIPCREPEAVVRFWGVILGSEPEDIEGKGSWFIGANIGRTGASFEIRRPDWPVCQAQGVFVFILHVEVLEGSAVRREA